MAPPRDDTVNTDDEATRTPAPSLGLKVAAAVEFGHNPSE
jgi:hypothetical protein